ncbi:hypothetical protein IAT40_004563 [Kwoniella sp. CBS 6097]
MAEEEVDWDDDWRGPGHDSVSAPLDDNIDNDGDGGVLGLNDLGGASSRQAAGEDADDVLSLDGDGEGEGEGEGDGERMDQDIAAQRVSPRKSSTTATVVNGNAAPTGPSSSRAPPTGPRKSVTRPPTGPRVPSSSATATPTPTGPKKSNSTQDQADTSVNASPGANTSTGASASHPSNVSNTTSTSTPVSTVKSGANGSATGTSNGSSKVSTAEEGVEAPLPPGWQAIMSKSHQRPFYFHKESNTTVWDRPTAPIASQAKEGVPPSPPLGSAEGTNSVKAASTANSNLNSSEEKAVGSRREPSKTDAPAGNGDSLNAKAKAKSEKEEKKPPTGPSANRQADPAPTSTLSMSTSAGAGATQSAAALAYAGRKSTVAAPSGPSFAKRGAEKVDAVDYARNSSRDTRQSDIDSDRRRQREISPRPSGGQDDRDSKRFRVDDSRRDGRPANDFRQPRSPPRSQPPRGPRQDDFPPRSQPGPRGPAQDDRPRPFDRSSRYPPGDSRTPARSPPPSRYSDSMPPSGRRVDTGPSIPTGPGGRYPPRESPRDHPSSRGPPSSSSSARDSAEAVRAQIREEQRKAEARLKFLKDEEERLARVEAEEAKKKRQQEEDDRRRRQEDDDRRRREDDDRRRREDEQRPRRDMYPHPPRPSRRDGPYSPDRRPMAFPPPPPPPADRSRYDAYRPDDIGGPPLEPRGSSRSYRPLSPPPPMGHGRYPRDEGRYRRSPPPGPGDFDRPLSSRIDGPRFRDDRDRDRDFDRPRRPLSPPGGVRLSDPPLSARLGRRTPPPMLPMSARLGPRRNGDSYHPDGAEPPRDLASRLGMGGGGPRRNELSAEPMSAQAQDRDRERERDRDRRSPPPPPPPFRRDRERERDDRSLSARPMAERMSIDPSPSDGVGGRRAGGGVGGDRYDPREREWRR